VLAGSGHFHPPGSISGSNSFTKLQYNHRTSNDNLPVLTTDRSTNKCCPSYNLITLITILKHRLHTIHSAAAGNQYFCQQLNFTVLLLSGVLPHPWKLSSCQTHFNSDLHGWNNLQSAFLANPIIADPWDSVLIKKFSCFIITYKTLYTKHKLVFQHRYM